MLRALSKSRNGGSNRNYTSELNQNGWMDSIYKHWFNSITIVLVLIFGPLIFGSVYVFTTQPTQNRVSTVVPAWDHRNKVDQTPTIITNTTQPNSTTLHEHIYNREFSDRRLSEIFNKYINKPNNYLNEYQWISNDTWWKPHCKNVRYISRAIECTEFYRMMTKQYNLTRFDKCLSINAVSDPEWKFLKCKEHTDLKYNSRPKRQLEEGSKHLSGDIYLMDLPDKGTYDFFLVNQMLEHFYDPKLAMHRINEHLKLGGYLWITVPVINKPHMTPIHFYHLQPMALATLAISTGFKIIELGWWGNRDYVEAIFKEKWWPNVKYYTKYEPMKNEWRYASQTWALVQKERSISHIY